MTNSFYFNSQGAIRRLPIFLILMACGSHQLKSKKNERQASNASGQQHLVQDDKNHDAPRPTAGLHVDATHFKNIQLSKSHELLPQPSQHVQFYLALDVDMAKPVISKNGISTSFMQFLFASKLPSEKYFEPRNAEADHFQIQTNIDLSSLNKPYDIRGQRIFLKSTKGLLEIGRFLPPADGQELFTLTHPLLCEEEYASVCRIGLETLVSDSLHVNGQVHIETLQDDATYISHF